MLGKPISVSEHCPDLLCKAVQTNYTHTQKTDHQMREAEAPEVSYNTDRCASMPHRTSICMYMPKWRSGWSEFCVLIYMPAVKSPEVQESLMSVYP